MYKKGRSTVFYEDYDEYLKAQGRRAKKTKRNTIKYVTWAHPKVLKDLRDRGINGKSILCLGARHESEPMFFLENGFEEAVGIELYDRPPHIFKCDMSRMYEHPYFADKKFDIVFAHESLEHCLDLEGLVKGLQQVCTGYFVSLSPNVVEPTYWDAAKHSFMNLPKEECDKELVECFPGFELVHSTVTGKNLYIILKRVSGGGLIGKPPASEAGHHAGSSPAPQTDGV